MITSSQSKKLIHWYVINRNRYESSVADLYKTRSYEKDYSTLNKTLIILNA